MKQNEHNDPPMRPSSQEAGGVRCARQYSEVREAHLCGLHCDWGSSSQQLPHVQGEYARYEKAYRSKIINSGEYGTRDNTIKRLGFQFKDKKKEKIKKCHDTEDKNLKTLAFKWSFGEPSRR